jgi:UrcA family protein
MKASQLLSTGIFVLALTLSLAVSAAIKGTGTTTILVESQDLNLSTDRGKQVLRSRLKRAAKRICGSQNMRTAGSLSNARNNKTCYDEALAGALQSIENRYLTVSREDS